jgi:hypothetical protein
MAARFRLMRAIALSQQKFSAGDVVTDTVPLTEAGDKHWPGLTAAKMHAGMVPLNPEAQAMKDASPWANEVLSATVLGVDSIR